MKWFIKCIKNYVNFKGRARRKEYWMFTLFTFLFMLVVSLLGFAFFGESSFNPLQSLFALFIFLPQLAVLVRRLHDTNRSGKRVLWCYLATFVWTIVSVALGLSSFATLASGSLAGVSVGFLLWFFIGGFGVFVWSILFLVWTCQSGTVGVNQYGPDPKAIEE